MAFANPLTIIQPQAAPADDFTGPEFAPFNGTSRSRNGTENSVLCTACGKSLNYDHPGQFRMHPKLKVIECKQCFDFYHTGQFIQDEDGMDEYCLWCGDGGNLIMCSYCHHAFCSRCINRNFSSRTCMAIKNKPDWPCFVCDETQLLGKVRRCKKIMKKIGLVGSSEKMNNSNNGSLSSLVEGNRHLDDLIAPMISSLNRTEETNTDNMVLNGYKKVTPITILREKESYIVQQKSISCDERVNVEQAPTTQSDPECRLNTFTKNGKTSKLLQKVAELQAKYRASNPVNDEPTSDKENIDEKGCSDNDTELKELVNGNGHKDEKMQCEDDQLESNSLLQEDKDICNNDDINVSPPLVKSGRNVGRRTNFLDSSLQTQSPENVIETKKSLISNEHVEPNSSSQIQSSNDANATPMKTSNNKQNLLQKSSFNEKLKEADSCLTRLTEIFNDITDDKYTLTNPLTSPSQYTRFRATSTLLNKVKKTLSKLDDMKNTLRQRKTHLGTFRESDHADSFKEDDSDVEMRMKNTKHNSVSSPLTETSFSEDLELTKSELTEPNVVNETLPTSLSTLHSVEVEDEQPSTSQPFVDVNDVQNEQPFTSRPSIDEKEQSYTQSLVDKDDQLSHSPLIIDANEQPSAPQVFVDLTEQPSTSQPFIIQSEQPSTLQPRFDKDEQPVLSQLILPKGSPKVILKRLSQQDILKFSQKSHVSDANCSSSETTADGLSDTDSSKNKLRSNKFGISDMSSTSTESESSSSYSGKQKKSKNRVKSQKRKSEKVRKYSDSDYIMDEDDEYFYESDFDQPSLKKLSQSNVNDNEIAMNMLLQKMQDDESSDGSDSDVENLLTRSATANKKKIEAENKNDALNKSSKEGDRNLEKGYCHPLLRQKWKDSESGSETTNDGDEKASTSTRDNKRKREVEEPQGSDSKKPRRKLVMGVIIDSDPNLTTDSESDLTKKSQKRKVDSKRLLIVDSDSSDSDAILIESGNEKDDNEFDNHILSSSDESRKEDSSNEDEPKKRQRKKRRRLVASDSDIDVKIKEEPFDEDDDNGSQKQGRRNIRKILDDDEVSRSTQQASKDELKRRKRLENGREFEEEKEDIIVIDENSQTPIKKSITVSLKLSKDPVVEVHQHLVKSLKPHQVEGIQFLWENIIEKVKIANTKRGNGCILAHCMGLGKTLQTVTFLHTVLMSKHLPKLRTALVLCPFGTINNWVAEFKKWLPKSSTFITNYKFEKLPVCDLNSAKNDQERSSRLRRWQAHGGVMVVGYGLFRTILSNKRRQTRKSQSSFVEQLSSPGPDILICDEGHILKNAMSHIANIVQDVNTRRRIILTGTPLQNNMIEYHCMVSVVKPKLLGTLKEFKNRFMNPIENGQHVDSTETDVKLMKKRAHVLHELLAGCVQRKDYTCLCAHLAPKYEYVLNVRLSDLQIRLYEKYISMHSSSDAKFKKGCMFNDFNKLLLLVCHPRCLVMEKERRDYNKIQDNIRKFGNDADENAQSEEEDSSDDSIILISDDELQSSQAPKPTTLEDIHALSGSRLRQFIEDKSGERPLTKNRKKLVNLATKYLDINFCKTEEFEQSLKTKSIQELKAMVTEHGGSTAGCTEKTDLVNLVKSIMQCQNKDDGEWFEKFMPTQQNLAFSNVHGGKIILMLEILRGSCEVGDKVVIFSQSLLTLDLIEEVLKDETKDVNAGLKENNGPYSKWYKNKDYFRLDGSTPGNLRDERIALFNNKKNNRVRLFLISTRAGGIGINLVGANRAIVFDASWNPTHDIQSIFRLYRFGQTKPCYIYRFIAQGTMEEKIYERQVMKLSLAFRVIDEQQILRHFSASDISELYKFEPAPKPDKTKNDVPQGAPPCDALLASILKNKDFIVSYHEHDSLLNHQVSEELSDADRRAAWEEYDREQNKLTSINSVEVFERLDPDVLHRLCVNADEILATIQKNISKIEEKPFQQIMTEIQMTNRNVDVDSVAKLATKHKLEQHITLRRLTALRKIVMQYGAEAQKCFHNSRKAIGNNSTSTDPPMSSSSSRPFVTLPTRPINTRANLPPTAHPNRFAPYVPRPRPSQFYYRPQPQNRPQQQHRPQPQNQPQQRHRLPQQNRPQQQNRSQQQKTTGSNIRYGNSYRFVDPRHQPRGYVPTRPGYPYSSSSSHTTNHVPRHSQMPPKSRYNTLPK